MARRPDPAERAVHLAGIGLASFLASSGAPPSVSTSNSPPPPGHAPRVAASQRARSRAEPYARHQHPPAPSAGPRAVCWDFTAGRCTRGAQCKFMHVGGPVAQAAAALPGPVRRLLPHPGPKAPAPGPRAPAPGPKANAPPAAPAGAVFDGPPPDPKAKAPPAAPAAPAAPVAPKPPAATPFDAEGLARLRRDSVAAPFFAAEHQRTVDGRGFYQPPCTRCTRLGHDRSTCTYPPFCVQCSRRSLPCEHEIGECPY